MLGYPLLVLWPRNILLNTVLCFRLRISTAHKSLIYNSGAFPLPIQESPEHSLILPSPPQKKKKKKMFNSIWGLHFVHTSIKGFAQCPCHSSWTEWNLQQICQLLGLPGRVGALKFAAKCIHTTTGKKKNKKCFFFPFHTVLREDGPAK